MKHALFDDEAKASQDRVRKLFCNRKSNLVQFIETLYPETPLTAHQLQLIKEFEAKK